MGLKLYYLILFESCLPFQDMLGEEYEDDYFNDTYSDDSNFISLDDSNGEEEFEEDFQEGEEIEEDFVPIYDIDVKEASFKKNQFCGGRAKKRPIQKIRVGDSSRTTVL